MNVLDIEVSMFDSIKNTRAPIQVNLLEWLMDDSYSNTVQNLRNLKGEAYNKAKKELPGITPSGTFKTRKETGLMKHSGLIQFDIDSKDNSVNMNEMKQNVTHIPYVAYLSFSASGNGLWGLMPIEYPSEHKAHFRAIAKAFKNVSVTIDRAPSNVASFRFCSYDSEPYFNLQAERFSHILNYDKPRKKERNIRTKVEELIGNIQARTLDITEGYENWLKIAFALSEEFGESGRNYFHLVSQFHPNYNTNECDEQFSNCINSSRSGISIASFFHICKQNEIFLKRDAT